LFRDGENPLFLEASAIGRNLLTGPRDLGLSDTIEGLCVRILAGRVAAVYQGAPAPMG